MSDIEQRIRRLETIEAIKNLKARYWYCCDMKDVEGVRDCFADGPISIHYDGTGKHDHRDKLYEVFERLSMHENMVEAHHGGPSEIEVVGKGEAKATWGLVYLLTDTKRGSIHHVSGYYHDEYVETDVGWRIKKTRFEVCYATFYRWKEDKLSVSLMGRALPES